MANKHFFIPLLPDFHSHLTIPVAFCLKHRKGTNDQKTAKLRSDASKITWEVKIEDGHKLTDGWKEFALAHDLRIGDILIFRQEKLMSFHVTLFGPSFCEIQYESCLQDETILEYPRTMAAEMSFSCTNKKYPPRIYLEGKTPMQNKSMNHNCLLGNLALVRETIGSDVWNALRESSVGVLVKFVDNNFVWSGKIVHYFLTRQLAIKKHHEIWSLVGSQPIRFSLHEFAHITGLNTDPLPEVVLDVEYREFWKIIGVAEGKGPSYDELVLALRKCKSWTFEHRRMLGWLFVLSIGIYGLHHNSRIPLEVAKRVLDVEAFESYPWGRVAFTKLVDSIKIVSYNNNSYTLHGCVHVLVIWIYESVPAFGERFGNKIDGIEVPLLSWRGSRPTTSFEAVIDKEVDTYGKVRVKHFIVKPEEEIYPKWDQDVFDEELDNLIHDLINDRLIGTAWNVVKTQKKRKQRNSYHDDNAFEEKAQKTKEKKRSRPVRAHRARERVEQARGRAFDDEVRAADVLLLVNKLYEKLDNMEKNIGEKMDGIAAEIEDKMDSKLNETFKSLENMIGRKIATLETKFKHLRGFI